MFEGKLINRQDWSPVFFSIFLEVLLKCQGLWIRETSLAWESLFASWDGWGRRGWRWRRVCIIPSHFMQQQHFKCKLFLLLVPKSWLLTTSNEHFLMMRQKQFLYFPLKVLFYNCSPSFLFWMLFWKNNANLLNVCSVLWILYTVYYLRKSDMKEGRKKENQSRCWSRIRDVYTRLVTNKMSTSRQGTSLSWQERDLFSTEGSPPRPLSVIRLFHPHFGSLTWRKWLTHSDLTDTHVSLDCLTDLVSPLHHHLWQTNNRRWVTSLAS